MAAAGPAVATAAANSATSNTATRSPARAAAEGTDPRGVVRRRRAALRPIALIVCSPDEVLLSAHSGGCDASLLARHGFRLACRPGVSRKRTALGCRAAGTRRRAPG